MTEKGGFSREDRIRLRDRFNKNGLDGFQSHETIEYILTQAMPRSDIRPLAKRLLKRFKSLRGIFDAAPEELLTVKGVNENAALMIKLLKDVASVYLKEKMMGKDVIRSKQDVLDYLTITLSGERVERFLALYLNSRNEVLAVDLLHEGTINQTVVYPRKVIERAFKHNAHAVIFVHNHPSGDPVPSNVDWQLTGVLDRAARAVDLIVHDHLIIGRVKHFSARESGWLGARTGPVRRAAMPGSPLSGGGKKRKSAKPD